MQTDSSDSSDFRQDTNPVFTHQALPTPFCTGHLTPHCTIAMPVRG